METVEKKSKLCFMISKLYKNNSRVDEAKKYQRMGERYQQDGK
jgi:hypothetical protein